MARKKRIGCGSLVWRLGIKSMTLGQRVGFMIRMAHAVRDKARREIDLRNQRRREAYARKKLREAAKQSARRKAA